MPSILVAFDSQYGIGREGQIPWKCPEDMRRFKERTMGNIVIMGRRTAESIPGTLAGRLSIVLTRSTGKQDDNLLGGMYAVAGSLESALYHSHTIFPTKSIFIIGGEQVYREALEKDLVDTVYATKIHGLHGCDRFFPIDLIPRTWRHDIWTNHFTSEYHVYSKQS